MDWIERLNAAMAYIEENLTGEIRYEEAAKIACCSVFHFQRMFSYMAGIPLGEYIRRRRMTKAAQELRDKNAKVTDIALKYGYDSPTAFNRAFQGIHGIAPSKVRRDGVSLKAFPVISFKITIKGEAEMDYRIEEHPAFSIVGISAPMSRTIEENFAVVPKLWERAAKEGIIPRLVKLMTGEPKGMLGVSCCNSQEEWRYFIAAAGEGDGSQDLQTYQVPACTWAIFPGQGPMPQSIQELEKRIVTEWLPSSGYEYANAPDIEVYISPDPARAKYEVWLPITPKK
ncbi:MAG: AraC family transcriptional regulator [Bacillota bacterium]|nr:AraC family transcriptional regulator [Bacillota bacterium]